MRVNRNGDSAGLGKQNLPPRVTGGQTPKAAALGLSSLVCLVIGMVFPIVLVAPACASCSIALVVVAAGYSLAADRPRIRDGKMGVWNWVNVIATALSVAWLAVGVIVTIVRNRD